MRPILRLVYLVYCLTSSAKHRAARRLTRPGMTMLGGVVVAGLLGVDIYTTVAYQACLMLLCLMGASLICAWRFRMKFAAERVLSRFATVGTPFAYHIRLGNETGRVQRDLLVQEELADTRPTFTQFLAMQVASQGRARSFRLARSLPRLQGEKVRIRDGLVPTLEPGQHADVRMEFVPLKRGQVRLTGLTVARPDPLNLVKAFTSVAMPQSVLVLPRRYPLPPIALPGTMKYQPGGVAQASSVGESEEFISLRDYRHGDPLRKIHWRSWARAGRPIVKEYQDEFFVRHALVLDTFGDRASSEAFEEAVSVAASFACTIQTQESLLDLLFVGASAYCFTCGRGLAHTDQMLEVLAAVQVCRDKPFDTLENLVLNHVRLVSGCVCVLVSWDARRQEFVRKLKMLGVPMRVLVLKERGGQPLEAGPLREEPQHFHVLEVGAVAEGLARL